MRNRACRAHCPIPSSMFRSFALVFAGLSAVAASPVQAEKADRFKPLNVVVTKGTMTIRASRIEVRESPDGYHTAVAFGSPSQHATFRQKRDAPDEYIAG